jgi:hypothetical protein
MSKTSNRVSPPVALRTCVLAVAAAFPVAAFAELAARVEFAVGNPVAVSASGQSRPLNKGVEIQSGETINTNTGRLQLRFTDGAYVSLQPQSEFRIDEYRYNGKTDGSERGFFSLLKGGLRTITGLVGRTNKKNYQVSTTVATIGIRGTEYTIAYTNSITGSVGEGEINVCTGTGCVPFGSGQSFIVTDPNSRPQLTSQKTDLPPTPPGDPAGGVFQTANDSTKPNYISGEPPFVAGDVVTDSGLPASICGPASTLTQCVPVVGPLPPTFVGTQNYVVALANSVAIGSQGPTSLITGTPSTFNASGNLVSFPQGGVNTLSGGTYSPTGSDGLMAWGTFTSGTITGGAFAGTIPGGGGLHYVAALPNNFTLPTTGTFTFSPLTLANSGGGLSLTSASLTLAIGAPTPVTVMLGFSSGMTATGTASAINGNGTFTTGLFTYSTFCNSCVGHADGFFTGANATHAGVSYVITGGVFTASGAVPFSRSGP